eukprot:TRINITY_DN1150_c0_g1_i1.p1 TRINITY_DN1150_c0_g1~~TRINITY_DN1150_c0_g1_i1.p1  ORF type:complete len:122 (+),score=29.26 TRINITY_DN1150_c0_g1_i1:106-471(+)
MGGDRQPLNPPHATGEWDHGFCDCDVAVCCTTFFCLPCQLAYNHGAVEGRECSIFDCCVASCFPLCCGCVVRSKIREKYGVDGSAVGDFCAHFCCPLCATVQQTRQLHGRGARPAGMFMEN